MTDDKDPREGEDAPEDTAPQDAIEEEPEADSPEEDIAAEADTAEAEAAAEPESAPEEPEQPAEPDPAPEEKPAAEKKRGGGILVWFVFLLTLAALAGVGYLYYMLIHLDPDAEIRGALESAEADSTALVRSVEADVTAKLAEVEAAQSDALADALEAFDARMLAAEEGFTQSLSRIVNAAPPSEREWKLAETAYLLRVANHRLLMEQDARTALTMLEAADQILSELDDFALHRVRAALADEILALKRVRGADVQGVYLTIEAIKSQLSDLPVAVPEYLAEQPEPEQIPEDATLWQIISIRFFDLFEFRQVGRDGVRPLLAPDEELYLEQNIRLTLEQAQLAVLKRHQDVYAASLTNAKAWVQAYLAGDSEDVQRFAEELDALLEIDLAQPMPDISGSFATLSDVMRGIAPAEDDAVIELPQPEQPPAEAVEEAVEEATEEAAEDETVLIEGDAA